MFYNNFKIRHKLVLTNIFLMLLLAFIMGVVGIGYLFNVIERDALENINNITLEHGNKFDASMTARENLVRSLVVYVRETYDIGKYIDNNEYIRNYKHELTPIVYDMNILNNNVYIYFNPELDEITHDIWFFDHNEDGTPERMPEVTKSFYDGDEDKKPWFYGAIDERTGLWSNPFTSNIGLDDSYFTFSMPVYIEDKFVAIVGSDFVIRFLQEELRNLKIYNKGYYSIVSDGGQFVVHPDYEYSDTLSTIEDQSFKGLSEELNGIRVTGVFQNKKSYVSYYQLKNNWYLVATVPKSEVFAGLYGYLARITLVIIVVVLISVIYILAYSKKLIQPIEILSTNILEIGSGNYSNDSLNKTTNNSLEIDELIQEIDNMKFKLKNSFNIIEKQNKDLDNKVHERTREMTDANKELLDTLNEIESTREQIINTKRMKNLNNLVVGMSRELVTPIIKSQELMTKVTKEVRSTKLILYNNKLTKTNFLDFMEKIELLSDETFDYVNIINEKIELLKRKDIEVYNEEKADIKKIYDK